MKLSSPSSSQKDRNSVNRSAQRSRAEIKPVQQIKSNKFEPVSFKESIAQVDTIPIKEVTVDPQTIMRTHEAGMDQTNREITVPVVKPEDSSLAQETGSRILFGGGVVEKPLQKVQFSENDKFQIDDLDDQLSQNLRKHQAQSKDQKDYPLIIDIVQARGTPPDVQVLDRKPSNEQSKQDNKSRLSRQIMSGGSQEQLLISHNSLVNPNPQTNNRREEMPKSTKNQNRKSRTGENSSFYMTRQASALREKNRVIGITEQMSVSNMQRSLKNTQNSKVTAPRKSESKQSFKSQRAEAGSKSLGKTFVVRQIANSKQNASNQNLTGHYFRQEFKSQEINQRQIRRQLYVPKHEDLSTRNHDLTHLQNQQDQTKLQTQSGGQDGGGSPNWVALKGEMGSYREGEEASRRQENRPVRDKKRKDSQGVMSEEQIQILGKEAEDLLLQIEDGEESPPRQELLGTLGVPMSRGAQSSLGNDLDENYLAKTGVAGREAAGVGGRAKGDHTDTFTGEVSEGMLGQTSKVPEESKTIRHATEGSRPPLELNLAGIGNQPSIFNQPRRSNAKSAANLRALARGDETTNYKKSASGDGQNFQLSNYQEETARLKNTARQPGKESRMLERVDTNEFRVYATQKGDTRNQARASAKVSSNLDHAARHAKQQAKRSFERVGHRGHIGQAKSQKNFRQTLSQFQMLQQTKSSLRNKRRPQLGAKAASKMANPELGISTRRISAIRRRGPAADTSLLESGASLERPAVTKLHVAPMNANVPQALPEGGKADQTENSRDAMIKLVDLDRYLHQGEASPSRKSQLQTLNGASATGLPRLGRSSGHHGGAEKPLAASISLASLKAINRAAAEATRPHQWPGSQISNEDEVQVTGAAEVLALEKANGPARNETTAEENLGKAVKTDQKPKQGKEGRRDGKAAALVLASALHTPPALGAIYSPEDQANASAAVLTRDDRGHAEKIRRLQAHQQALQLGGGTIERQAASQRSESELWSPETAAREVPVSTQPGAMSIEGTQLRGPVPALPGAGYFAGGRTVSSPNTPGRTGVANDTIKSQTSKLEAAVLALNGAAYQNRLVTTQPKPSQASREKYLGAQNTGESAKSSRKKKDRDLQECSEASTLKRSSILERPDQTECHPPDNSSRFAGQILPETAQERRIQQQVPGKGEVSGAKRPLAPAFSARATRGSRAPSKSQAGTEIPHESPQQRAAASNSKIDLWISRPSQAMGCQTEQTIVQRSLQFTSSLAILQASQRLAERGLVFGQLAQDEQNKVLAEQHQILLSIEASRGYAAQLPTESARPQTSGGETGPAKNTTMAKSQSQTFAKSISSRAKEATASNQSQGSERVLRPKIQHSPDKSEQKRSPAYAGADLLGTTEARAVGQLKETSKNLGSESADEEVMRPSSLNFNQKGPNAVSKGGIGEIPDVESVHEDPGSGAYPQERAKHEHFEAKNTGVGTEELEQLWTTHNGRGPGRSPALSELNVAQLTRLAQLYPDVPLATLSAAALSQVSEDRLRVSIFQQNPDGRQIEASSQLALRSPASSDFSATRLAPRREENQTSDDRRKELELVSFAHYLATLGEAQKSELYKQQLQQALGYQMLSDAATPAFTSPSAAESRGGRATSNLAGQLFPRIIINNALGPNKVVHIDPYYGTSQDLYRERQERQKGIEVVGESVTVLKGTGPGAAMAVPSFSRKSQLVDPSGQQWLAPNQEQTPLGANAAFVQDFLSLPPSSQFKSGKGPQMRAASFSNSKRSRQLNCDTVVVKTAIPLPSRNERNGKPLDYSLVQSGRLDAALQAAKIPSPLPGFQGDGAERVVPFSMQPISFRNPAAGDNFWPSAQPTQEEGPLQTAFVPPGIFTEGSGQQGAGTMAEDTAFWVQRTHDGYLSTQGRQEGLQIVGGTGDSAPGLMGNPVYGSRPVSGEPSLVSGAPGELGPINNTKDPLETPDAFRGNLTGNVYSFQRATQASQASQIFGKASGSELQQAGNPHASRTAGPLVTGATGSTGGPQMPQTLLQDSAPSPNQFRVLDSAQAVAAPQRLKPWSPGEDRGRNLDMLGIGTDVQIQSRRSSRPQQQPHLLPMKDSESTRSSKLQKTAQTPGRELPSIDRIVEEAVAGEHAVSSDALSTSGHEKRHEETARMLEPRHAFENPSTKTASPDFSQFSLSGAPGLRKALLQPPEPLPTEQYSSLRPPMQQLASPTSTKGSRQTKVAQNPPMPFPGRPKAQITNSNSQFSRTLYKDHRQSRNEQEPKRNLGTGQGEDLQKLLEADEFKSCLGPKSFSKTFERQNNSRYYYVNQQQVQEHLKKFRRSVPSAQADLYPETRKGKQSKCSHPKMVHSDSSFERGGDVKIGSLGIASPESFKNQEDKIQLLQRNKYAEPSGADPGTARLGNSNSVVEDALPNDPKYQYSEKAHNNSTYLQKKEKSQFKLSTSNNPTLKSDEQSASAFRVFKQSKKEKKELDIVRDDKRAFILVKNQPNAMYGTRKFGGRASNPNNDWGNKGLLSKISGEIKTAIQQNSKSQSKISQVVIQKWSAYETRSQPVTVSPQISPNMSPKENVRREVIASRQNLASNLNKAFKDNNAMSSFGSDEKIKSLDQSQMNDQNPNSNELAGVQKSEDILKDNPRVNTMFVQEDSSDLAIEKVQPAQQSKTQAKNSQHRSIAKSDRITDGKVTEKTETIPACGSSFIDQVKQRSPYPNFEMDGTVVIESTTKNLAKKSIKDGGLIDYNQDELATPVGTLTGTGENLQNTQDFIVCESQILETFQASSRQEQQVQKKANAPEETNRQISFEAQDQITFNQQILQQVGSPNRFELPKASILGDLKSVYNPNFHDKRQMSFYSHTQSGCCKQEKRHNQYYTAGISQMTDEKSFYPKTPMSNKPIFKTSFQNNLDLNMGHLKQMNKNNKEITKNMQKMTRKGDKISDLVRRQSKFSGLETRNFSSELALTQSFDNRDTSSLLHIQNFGNPFSDQEHDDPNKYKQIQNNLSQTYNPLLQNSQLFFNKRHTQTRPFINRYDDGITPCFGDTPVNQRYGTAAGRMRYFSKETKQTQLI